VPPEQDGITNGVRFALRGLMFLRSRPDVDPAQVCLVGTSAGAHLALIVAGLDPGLKAVAVKYGEGFIRDLPGYFGGYFGPITLCPKAEQDAWLAVLDPKHGMPNYKANVLLLSGTDDIFFWMPIVLKTYREIPSPKRLIMNPNDNHGQVGNTAIPIRYLKSILGQAPAFPEVAPPTIRADEKSVVLTTKASGPSKGLTISFAWKRMPLATFDYRKNWQIVKATAGANGEWTAEIPASHNQEQLVAYAIVEDETGARAASDTAEWPAYPSWRGLPQILPQAKAEGQVQDDGNMFLDASFEAGSTKRGKVGNLYLNYVGAPVWDATGTKAHTGKTAVGITGGDKNYLAVGAPGEGGKKYRLAGYFRGERDGVKVRLQINWGKAGGGLIKFDLRTPTLLTEYGLCEMIVDAPADTTGALLIISGGSGADETVWMDDVYFGEVTPKADDKTPPAK
jgi:hypothetical protein